ncbi:MAG TPA: SurA N-terminal domain-containing protein [Pyrinomonadaceae bacterium]|nr:SurA N-terminal domain-containing protein [Pyrinomonadaceae bacterium]
MLKQLSRLKHTQRIIVFGFVLLLAVSLIAFFGPGRNSTIVEPARNTTLVASVNGEEITVAEVARLKDNYMQMFGGRISMAQLGGYKRFVEGLIRDRVVAQEAARLGLSASDQEVAEKIRKQFSDASGQFVGMERYKQSVTARYGDLEAFERTVRDDIAQEKLRAFVTAAVKVSDNEVQEDFKRKQTDFDVTYTIISADKLAEKIQPTEEELKSHYEQHKDDFKISVPQKKVRYVYVDQAKAGEKLQISDKELRDEFDKLSPENKQAGIKVQQIMLKVARKDLDAQVEQKAKDLIAKAQSASPETQEKVFADLARGNSEDPATAKNGGYLPQPFRKNPNKVHGLLDRTIDVAPGNISEIPIKYAGNWYILRRGDAVPKTFEEARQELLVSMRNRKGYVTAASIAERAKSRLKETKDPQKVAQELAADANMSPAEMVKETPFIKPGDDVPGIGSSQQFEAAIAPLNNANDVGEQTGVKGGFAVPMLVDKKEPRTPSLEEVKTEVAKAVKQQRSREQLEQKAKELASSINSAADLKAAAEKAGFEVETTEGYKLGSALGKAGSSAVLEDSVYALKSGEVTKSPLKINDTYVVLGVTNRKEADLAEFAKQRDQLKLTMLSAKQNQIYEDYISTVQQRMKRDGKIKIYSDVLTSLEESEPEIAPTLPGQFPGQQ